MVFFKDGIIHMQDEPNPRATYDEIRTAVYDNGLPLIKVIGFKVIDTTNPESVRVSDRHNAILENMIELAGTFNEIIFLPQYHNVLQSYILNSEIINMNQKMGKIYAGTADFKSGGAPIEVLNKDLYICYALQPINFRLIAIESTGFITMERSVEQIRHLCADMEGFDPYSYFPLYNEFSIMDYVRILPPVGGQYRYHLCKGMTDEHLNILWQRKKVRS